MRDPDRVKYFVEIKNGAASKIVIKAKCVISQFANNGVHKNFFTFY